MIDFPFVLLRWNCTILRYKRELIFVEYLFKNIVLKINSTILFDEFSEMVNIHYEWYEIAYERMFLVKNFCPKMKNLRLIPVVTLRDTKPEIIFNGNSNESKAIWRMRINYNIKRYLVAQIPFQ